MLGAWSRREAVLIAALAAAGSVVALGAAVGVTWLTVVGLAIAAAGAIARLVIAARRAKLEGQRESAELQRRLRVPPAPVASVDPTLIGVDRAEQTILEGAGVVDIEEARSAALRLRVRGDTATVIVDSDGEHTVRYRAYDVAGNPSQGGQNGMRSVTFQVDRTPADGGMLPSEATRCLQCA